MTISQTTIEGVESLARAVRDANKRFPGQVWWRGQGNSAWDLSPSVVREDSGYDYERQVILRFKQRAPSRQHLTTPREDDYFQWLSLMLHHRLPTRVLDWTESPLYALYFAIEDENTKHQEASLFALSPYLLNWFQVRNHGVLMPESEIAIRAVRSAFGSNAGDEKYIVGIMPSETHPRMMVQLSVFTVHGSCRLLDDLPDKDNFLLEFRVPADAKCDLLKQLKHFGVRESNLFPDLDHLAKEVKNLHFNRPPVGSKPPDWLHEAGAST